MNSGSTTCVLLLVSTSTVRLPAAVEVARATSAAAPATVVAAIVFGLARSRRCAGANLLPLYRARAPSAEATRVALV
jgi:hypothetical protein